MKLLLTLLVLLSSLQPALAATISIAPSYVQSFDAALAPLGELPADGATTPVGGYLQYEFRMTLDDAAPGEDFWTAIFNIQLGPGLEIYSPWLDPATAQLNGFYPDAPSLAAFDSNGPATGGMQFHWQLGNEDFGVDPNDLQSIIVEAAASEAANRQYGELARPAAGAADGLGLPTLIGTIIVRRSALIPTAVSLNPIGGSPWGIYVGNSLGSGVATSHTGASFSGGTAVLQVPEPASWTLAICALAGMFALQRVRLRSRV